MSVRPFTVAIHNRASELLGRMEWRAMTQELRQRIGLIVEPSAGKGLDSARLRLATHLLRSFRFAGNCGPHKTIYNRFIRWSRLGVFNRIFAERAGKAGEPERIMIDATHLKAYRTAASLLKGGLFPDVSGAPKVA